MVASGQAPVEILVHNVSFWLANTFLLALHDRFGRRLEPVSARTHDQQFLVDARAGALLIAEFARRHQQRSADWGRIIGLTSGGPSGFPGEVSYGAAKAALENYIQSAAQELGRFGITANLVYPPATDTGWIKPEVERAVLESSPLRRVGQPKSPKSLSDSPRDRPVTSQATSSTCIEDSHGCYHTDRSFGRLVAT